MNMVLDFVYMKIDIPYPVRQCSAKKHPSHLIVILLINYAGCVPLSMGRTLIIVDVKIHIRGLNLCLNKYLRGITG